MKKPRVRTLLLLTVVSSLCGGVFFEAKAQEGADAKLKTLMEESMKHQAEDREKMKPVLSRVNELRMQLQRLQSEWTATTDNFKRAALEPKIAALEKEMRKFELEAARRSVEQAERGIQFAERRLEIAQQKVEELKV